MFLLFKEVLLARSQANTDGGGRGEGLAWRRYPLPTPTTPGGGDGERGQGVDLRRRTLCRTRPH